MIKLLTFDSYNCIILHLHLAASLYYTSNTFSTLTPERTARQDFRTVLPFIALIIRSNPRVIYWRQLPARS